MIIKTDGSVDTQRYCFYIGDNDFLQISDVGVNKDNRLFQTIFSGLDLSVVNNQGQLGTLTGQVIFEGTTVGSISISDKGVINWPETLAVNQPGEYTLDIAITSPFKYNSQQTIRKIQLPINISTTSELFSFIENEVSVSNSLWVFLKQFSIKTGKNTPSTLAELLTDMRVL